MILTGPSATPGKYEVLAGADDTLVASHFGSVRAGFNDQEHGASGSGGRLQEVWLPSVLNVGVRPDVAVRRARRRFEEQGGVVREHTACDGVVVGEKSAQVTLDEEVITTRLVVDAMGNASPVARQCRREANDGADPRPSGICCVVGTCVEINQCDGCTRQFFTKSFLGDDAAVLALSSGEEPASPRHRAGVASMAWRTTRRFSTNAP